MSPMSISEADEQLTAPGQMFEVAEMDIRGITTRVWKNAPPNLRSVLEISRSHASKDFLVYEDERITFGQHYSLAARVGKALTERFGVQKGDRVAIAMRNLPEWATAFWATTAMAGAVVVPLNAWWTGPELAYGLSDSSCTVAFVDSERLERIMGHLPEMPNLRAVVVTDENRRPGWSPPRADVPVVLYDEIAGTAMHGPGTGNAADLAAELGSAEEPPALDIDPEDDATIFYTSGTTGRPKGAVGTHRNICTNLMSLFFIATRAGLRGTGGTPDPASKRQNSYLLSVPLFHATGCHAILVTNTAAGGKLVMMHHFDPQRALELIEREQITTFGGVPAMVMQVLDSPDFLKRDTSSITSIAYGGAPAPPDMVRRIKEHFPVGAPSNGYGLTETSSVTTMNSGDDYIARPDSVGPPVPVCELAVVPEDYLGPEPTPEHLSARGVLGELWVKGPNVVRGYWEKPEETAATFTAGWLHTGDIATIDDDGFVHIVDRAKDMVIRGGENVYSVEVEATLFEHPAVADCAVIGIPHPVLGEEVGAVVVLRPGQRVSADELVRHVRERMAAFNAPARIWFRSDPLPRNPQGKVLKRQLREELATS